MAPLVAARVESPQQARKLMEKKGWTIDSLTIPEVSYHSLFSDNAEAEELDSTILATIDKVLSSSYSGIIKIVDLPEPNFEDERNHINNVNTKVLKQLFTSVFVHPIRGADTTFNVSSHNHDATRKVGLPNYDTTQILLPHVDHHNPSHGLLRS